MSFSDLPAVNASLNAFTAVLLVLGLRFIKRGNRNAHRNCMITACCASLLFLACYVTYHTWMRRTYGAAHTTFLALLRPHGSWSMAGITAIGATSGVRSSPSQR